MKLKDLLWLSIIFIFALILIIDQSREVFLSLTHDHPYIMGFVKTSILATMGELLASRIVTGNYFNVIGIPYKFVIWGLIGMSFALVFKIFGGGIVFAQSNHLLPAISGNEVGNKILTAFLTSLIMNLIFAPTFMAFHRITDTYIELGNGSLKNIKSVKIDSVINTINWNYFIKFIVLITVPIFWVPAHTITFLLPSEFQVLMAAVLSIILGLILSLSKKKNQRLSA